MAGYSLANLMSIVAFMPSRRTQLAPLSMLGTLAQIRQVDISTVGLTNSTLVV